MGNIYISSDEHLGHSNIIKHCNRPFWKEWDGASADWQSTPDVHLMNKTLIDNINDIVKENDTLKILGDMCYRGKSASEYRKLIRCRNVDLILGNHDDHNISKYVGFRNVCHYEELRYNGKLIVLSHYPLRSWRNSNHGSLHLFGHCHGNMPAIGRSLDVGVDCHDYKPLLLDDVIAKLEQIPLHKDYRDH